jgi:hypothetical protein
VKNISALLALAWFSALTVSGGSLTVGANNGGNCVPFGCNGVGTNRYQEAYANSLFSPLGPISITGLDFFLVAAGNLAVGTYQLSLSTITADVNSLSNTNFDSNLGPDNTLFTTVALSGASPSELTFTGGPFLYNPANGNLLLDVQVRDAVLGTGGAMFEDGSGSGPGTIARYQDTVLGTTGYGLVTRFDYGAVGGVPEPGTLGLLACGLAGVLIRRFRR